MRKLSSFISTIFNHNYFLVFIVIACSYTQITESDRYFGWTNPKNTLPENNLTINTDGSGYYAYLPQWFIYSDSPHFSYLPEICKKYHTDKFASGIRMTNKNKRIDKYFIGTPICISPFFFINHIVQKARGKDSDGYSKSYQFSISISALFYSLLGIIGLVRLLKFFNLSNSIISLMVVFTAIGTSVNFYASFNPSFSHIYSFCAVTWFLYFSKRWAIYKKANTIIWLGFLLGLIFIIRPTNIFIFLITPFLFNNRLEFKNIVYELFTKFKSKILISFLLFSGLLFLQLYNVHSQIGKWTFNTYSDEHFDFLLNPKWFEVLFGYGKGFFIYNPIMILLIPSIIWGLFKRNYLVLGFFLFFVVITYLTSSWWCWWYGGGLGMRPFVDFTSLFILIIALFYDSIHTCLKSIVFLFSFFVVYFYQILQFQFNRNILHYDLMTKEKFWSIFLKTEKRYNWMSHFEDFHIKGTNKSQVVRFKPKEFTMTFESKDPLISIKFPSNWYSNKLGVRFQGEFFLSNPESNPSLIMFFYKKGKVIKQIDQYFGNRIDELNEFYPFSKDYIDTTHYSNIDSVQLLLTRGYPITKAKDLKCTFYSLK